MGFARRRSLFTWAALIGGLVVGLVLAETLLRLDVFTTAQLELDIYRFDRSRNLALRPGLARRHTTKLWSVSIETNTEGRRGPEAIPLDGRPVVVGLGDSFGFGWGVEFDETLFRRLEDASPKLFRWVNASVPGTSPNDHARRLPKLIEQYQPAIVALLIFVGNDFSEAPRSTSERFEVTDGLLIPKWASQSFGAGLRQALSRGSRLLQALRALQFDLQRGLPNAGRRAWDSHQREFARVHLAAPPREVGRAIEQTLEYLGEIESLCRRSGADLLVIVAPAGFQVVEAEQAAMIEALGVAPDDIDLDRPQRLLIAWAAQRRLPLVDTLPALREARSLDPNAKLYHYPDAHWTARGHKIAARAAADTLNQIIASRDIDITKTK